MMGKTWVEMGDLNVLRVITWMVYIDLDGRYYTEEQEGQDQWMARMTRIEVDGLDNM